LFRYDNDFILAANFKKTPKSADYEIQAFSGVFKARKELAILSLLKRAITLFTGGKHFDFTSPQAKIPEHNLPKLF
jgi:hypothetical protein